LCKNDSNKNFETYLILPANPLDSARSGVRVGYDETLRQTRVKEWTIVFALSIVSVRG
jgi:hypothetical protein